jgi:hypothetical protein
MKDGEEVIELVGREAREDRRQVDEMLAIARNFVAVSDLSRTRLTRLELLEEPPEGLPRTLKRAARKLEWIRVASPDFALLEDQVRRPAAGKKPVFRVDLGLSREEEDAGLPAIAIVHEEVEGAGTGASRPAPPMLIELRVWQPCKDGFRVPRWIQVYRQVSAPGAKVFQEKAAQDITIREVDLRPTFTAEDFAPKGA